VLRRTTSRSPTGSPAPSPSGWRLSSALTVKTALTVKFGGGWAGYKKALTEALLSGGPRACVQLGANDYAATDAAPLITKNISIRGVGRGTRFHHAGTYDGWIIRADNLKRSGQLEGSSGSQPTTVNNYASNRGGLELRDFVIADDDRSRPNRGGIYALDLDDALLDSLEFQFLTGTALKLGADDADATISGVSSGRIRESDFRRIRIYRCGSGSPNGTPDVPAFILQNGNDAGDGTNQNYFEQFRFVYNEGRMLIRGAGNGGNSLRRTIFRDVQLHALADNGNWSPSKWFPFDLVTLEGAVRETFFLGVMLNGTKAGTAAFAMKGHALNGETPKRLVVRDVNVVNVAGDLVRVEAGDSVAVEGTGLGSVGGAVLTSPPGSGLSKFYVHEMGINAVSAGKVTVGSGSGSILNNGTKV
jgi:hypothetical protein